MLGKRFDELLLMEDGRFFALLDLERDGLEAVRRAVERADYEAARTALLGYYRDLEHTPFGALPPVGEGSGTTEDGERALAHWVSVWGREVRLPAEIPWLRPDVSHPHRGDYHVVSQLNEHGLMRRLADAYRQTGRGCYARHAVELMLHWLKSCTPLPRTRQIDSDRAHVWYNPAHSTRVANWSYIFFALRHFPGVSDEEWLTLLKTIFREQEYKRDNYQGNPNHIISQLLGFVKFATWWGEFRVARTWAAEALEKLRQGLDDFFYEDGAYVELCYMHGDLVEAWKLAREYGFPIAEDFAEKAAKTFDFPLYAAHPRGGYPPWNDSGGQGREDGPLSERAGGFVELGAEFTGREDLRYVNTRGREGRPPEHTSHYFPRAGFFAMRSDWTSQARFLMLDGGRNLGGYQHPHMDQLSFVLAAWGHTLVTDTGYGGPWHGRWRQEYYVATPGHNAIAVDGQWQAQYPEERPEENERWQARPMIGNLWSVSPGLVARGISRGELAGNRWLSEADFDYARSVYDQGFTRDPRSQKAERLQVVHERRVLFLKPDYWLLTDLLHGEGMHHFEAYFHFPVAARAQVAQEGIEVCHHSARLRLLPLCAQPVQWRVVAGQREPIQGWMPAGWGEHVPAPAAIVHGRVRLPLVLHTVLFPDSGEQLPRVRAALLEGDGRLLEVRVGERRDLCFAGEGETRVGAWKLAGEMAALRLDEGGRVRARFAVG